LRVTYAIGTDTVEIRVFDGRGGEMGNGCAIGSVPEIPRLMAILRQLAAQREKSNPHQLKAGTRLCPLGCRSTNFLSEH
jgi:hypothetical protein